MKILNLYAGIGDNRQSWDGDITAVEIDSSIANIYKDFFPGDKMVIGDAHQFLLEHFNEFDFIWSSPPCPSHSIVRFIRKDVKPIYADMNLYEEIILLQHYFRGKWVVENVVGYYEPLITPQEVGKHYFWANFQISKLVERDRCMGKNESITNLQKLKGFDLQKYKNINKKLLLRNCVEPKLGRHIFECAFKEKQQVFEANP